MPVPQPVLQAGGQLQSSNTPPSPLCFQTRFRLFISHILAELVFSLYNIKIEIPSSCELAVLCLNSRRVEGEAMVSDEQTSTEKFMFCLSSLHKRLQGGFIF